ncbi:MAG: glycerol-3-phosphate acyltransferase, partial [Clostridia bacterium]|nr:glycerol-3-phosphate acyltransferase [Clostridia bacterium]
MWLTAVITFVAAYLIGSVNFAVIFTKAFTDKDVRNYGSGNAGTTNVMRVGGKTAGVLTFICDVLKGFAASLLGKFMFEYIAAHSVSDW